jgi:hypothetical protein
VRLGLQQANRFVEVFKLIAHKFVQ